MNSINQTNSQLLRMKQVQHITGLSRSYIYHLVAIGKFPGSFPLVPGGSSRAWLQAEIQEWIDERVAERDLEVVNV